MLLDIEPYAGIGPLRLGMDRAEVRARAGCPVREIPVDSVDGELGLPTVEADYFEALDAKVEYDRAGKSMFIEVGHRMDLVFEGKHLFELPYGKLLDEIQARDPDIEDDGAGFVSHALGFAVYAPEANFDPGLPPETASVFVAGYYDDPDLTEDDDEG